MATTPGRLGGTLATVSAALLTGGAASPMWRDRARLDLAGEPALDRSLRLLGSLVSEVLVVGGEFREVAGARFVPDVDGPECPLRGLVTALEATSCERLLVVAIDLPLVTSDLLLALVAWPEAAAVVPRGADGAQPLCALYERASVLGVARERLARGDLAITGLLDAVETSYLEPADLARLDPRGELLLNLDTPEDLAAVRAALARRV